MLDFTVALLIDFYVLIEAIGTYLCLLWQL